MNLYNINQITMKLYLFQSEGALLELKPFLEVQPGASEINICKTKIGACCCPTIDTKRLNTTTALNMSCINMSCLHGSENATPKVLINYTSMN